MEEGLRSLSQDKTVYFGASKQIDEVFNRSPQNFPRITQFDLQSSIYDSLILTKNSPLAPFFKKIAFKSIESGLSETLLREWIGPKIKHVANTEVFPLTIGQTFLLFMMMIVFVVAAFLVYLGEVLLERMSKKNFQD